MDEMKQGRREFIGVSAGAAAGIALAGGLPEIARA
ncbi:MAG TPA: twin-arginine translocation signal domain-containing protein, partial [Bacteroidetes bacterium]|nr:twin-arginine translocation signal domain-containing protein [Bacteroidota bacterium]HEX05638.1 twin-arginine translocation signal domain-containing protein [Bacteroidota bacterium]